MAGYTKEELKLQGKLKEYIDKNSELEKLLETRNRDILKLKKQITTLQAEIITKTSDKDIVKKILSLYAKNNSHVEIFEKMKYKGYREVTLDYVKEICDNREELDSDLVLYFKEQEESYSKQLNIDSDMLKDKIKIRYERLYNDAEYDLSQCETVDEKRKIREEMNKHLDKMNNMLKNVIDDKDSEKVDDNLSQIKDSVKELSKKVVKFDFGSKKIKSL